MAPEFSADPARIDVARVHRWLSEQAYWALGRTRADVEASIAGSRAYGVFEGGAQLAFARVVTDGAVFGWVLDVFVDEAARGRGVGKQLMAGIMADLEPLGLHRLMLRTQDAHGLYEQFGFVTAAEPEWVMEWVRRDGRVERSSPLVVPPGGARRLLRG